MFCKTVPADIEYLKTATAPDRVLTGDEIAEEYSHDELGGTMTCDSFRDGFILGARIVMEVVDDNK